MRRALAATFALGALIFTASVNVSAQEDGSATQAPELILRDNSFVVEMNGELFLGYDIVGDLEGFVALPSPFEQEEELDPAREEALAGRSSFEVVVTSHAPIDERSAVQTVLDGDPGPALDGARIDFDEVVQVDELLRPVGFFYAVPTSTGGNRAAELEFVREGLYPLTVELWRDGIRIARHITFAERLAAPDEPSIRPVPFQLAVIAGITDPGPEPSTQARARTRSELLELRDLATSLRSPITAIIPPSATAEFEELGDAAQELITALSFGEAMVLPVVQMNPSSMVAAGAKDPFITAVRAGEDLLSEQLFEVPLRRSAWPASDRFTGAEISRAGAGMIRDLGAQLILMSPETYLGLSGALPRRLLDTSLWHTADLPGGSSVALGLIDPVSTLVDPTVITDRSLTEAAVQAMAEISAQRYQSSSARRIAVISTPNLGVPEAQVMLRIEEMVERHPGFVFTTASSAAGSVDVYRTAENASGSEGIIRRVALPERAGPDLALRVADLSELRTRLEVVASMLVASDLRPDQWRSATATWLSSAYTDAEIRTRVADLATELDALPASIQLPEPFTFTLTGQVSEISLRIVNTSDVALRAVLHAEASKLTFPEAPLEVLLEPGVTTVEVAVRTLSNGTFGVQLELRTPVGDELIGTPLQLTARVNALTGLGQVLTGGAVVVLASWWFSHLRKRQRKRDLVIDDQ
jgi:hypothetical protein